MSKNTSINNEENMENVDLSDNIIDEEKNNIKAITNDNNKTSDKKEEVKTSAPKNNKDNSEYIAVNTGIILDKMLDGLKKYEELLNTEIASTKFLYNKNVRNNRKDTIIKLKDIYTKYQLANSLKLLLSLKNDLIEVTEQIIFDVVHTCNPFKDSRVGKIAGKAIKEIDEIIKELLGVNILKNEKISLLKKTKNIEIELDNIKGQYGSLGDSHKSLLNIIDEHTTTIINQNKIIKKKIEIEKTLYEEIKITKEDLESYKDESLKFQEKYDITYKENKQLEEKNIINNNIISELKEENKYIKDNSTWIKKNEVIEMEKKQLQETVIKKENEIKKIKEEDIKNLKEDNNRLKEKSTKLGLEKFNLEEDKIELKKQNNLLEEKFNNSENKHKETKEELKSANNKIINLEKENKALEYNFQESIKIKNIEIIDLQNKNNNLEKKIITLEEDGKKKDKEITKLKDDVDELKDFFQTLKKEREEDSKKNKTNLNNKSFVKKLEKSRENNNKDKDMGKN
jgi:hypothetical protein